MKRRHLLGRIALAAPGLSTLAAWAQPAPYPSRPIRFIVPFAAGSSPDSIARIVGQHMSTTLGQPIIIDNKPGANGLIAAQEAARAAPDGYTLFGGNNTTQAGNPSLYRKLPYDPVRDFIPVSLFIRSSLMLVVRPDYPANNMKEFLALARAANPPLAGGYASAGMQVALAELQSLGKLQVQGVPYRGVPQAVNDVMSGQIPFTFSDLAVGFAQLRGGKLKGLGVTSPQRSPLMKEMPAIAEELPGFGVTVWSGVVVPTGTPRDVVDKLASAAQKAVAAPEVGSKLGALGQEMTYLGPEDFKKFIATETVRWSGQIKNAGIEPE